MAWSTPFTAVSGASLLASQLNGFRDDLLETAPGKATAGGQLFVATAANAIVARTPTGASVATSETTTSSSYTDLTTVGPAVTVTTGTTALVFLSGNMSNNTANGYANMAYDISGASTIAASTDRGLQLRAAAINQAIQAGAAFLQTGLTAGSNTFTAKYNNGGSGTATFVLRKLFVIGL